MHTSTCYVRDGTDKQLWWGGQWQWTGIGNLRCGRDRGQWHVPQHIEKAGEGLWRAAVTR